MERTELLTSKEYWMEHLQNLLFQQVNRYLTSKGISKTQFAEQLNVSKSYISQVLNGDFDHKLSKFVELTLATGNVPLVDFKSIDEYLIEDAATYDFPSERVSYKRNTRFLENSNEMFVKLGHNFADCPECTPPGRIGQSEHDEVEIIPYEELC